MKKGLFSVLMICAIAMLSACGVRNTPVFPNAPVRSIEVTNCLSQEVRREEDADRIRTLMEQICLIRRGKEISMPPPGSTTMSLCVSYEDGTTVVCGDDALIAGKKAYEVRYPADWSWDAFFAAPGEG